MKTFSNIITSFILILFSQSILKAQPILSKDTYLGRAALYIGLIGDNWKCSDGIEISKNEISCHYCGQSDSKSELTTLIEIIDRTRKPTIKNSMAFREKKVFSNVEYRLSAYNKTLKLTKMGEHVFSANNNRYSPIVLDIACKECINNTEGSKNLLIQWKNNSKINAKSSTETTKHEDKPNPQAIKTPTELSFDHSILKFPNSGEKYWIGHLQTLQQSIGAFRVKKQTTSIKCTNLTCAKSNPDSLITLLNVTSKTKPPEIQDTKCLSCIKANLFSTGSILNTVLSGTNNIKTLEKIELSNEINNINSTRPSYSIRTQISPGCIVQHLEDDDTALPETEHVVNTTRVCLTSLEMEQNGYIDVRSKYSGYEGKLYWDPTKNTFYTDKGVRAYDANKDCFLYPEQPEFNQDFQYLQQSTPQNILIERKRVLGNNKLIKEEEEDRLISAMNTHEI